MMFTLLRIENESYNCDPIRLTRFGGDDRNAVSLDTNVRNLIKHSFGVHDPAIHEDDIVFRHVVDDRRKSYSLYFEREGRGKL